MKRRYTLFRREGRRWVRASDASWPNREKAAEIYQDKLLASPPIGEGELKVDSIAKEDETNGDQWQNAEDAMMKMFG